MSKKTFLAIVIGNTNLKWRVLNQADSSEKGSVSTEAATPDELRVLASSLNTNIASVNPLRLALLRKDIQGNISVMGKDISIPIENSTRFPGQVGVDRLLTALGAYKKYGPSIIVDIGTAITVDLVGEGPTFKGGAILPGIELCIKSLNRGTALLPEFQIEKVPSGYYGLDTEEAISCGVYWGITAAVSFLVDKINNDKTQLPVCITGGGAALITPHMKQVFHDEPDLIFSGIEEASNRFQAHG